MFVVIIWTVIYRAVKIFFVEIFRSLFKCSVFLTPVCDAGGVGFLQRYHMHYIYISYLFVFITD